MNLLKKHKYTALFVLLIAGMFPASAEAVRIGIPENIDPHSSAALEFVVQKGLEQDDDLRQAAKKSAENAEAQIHTALQMQADKLAENVRIMEASKARGGIFNVRGGAEDKTFGSKWLLYGVPIFAFFLTLGALAAWPYLRRGLRKAGDERERLSVRQETLEEKTKRFEALEREASQYLEQSALNSEAGSSKSRKPDTPATINLGRGRVIIDRPKQDGKKDTPSEQ